MNGLGDDPKKIKYNLSSQVKLLPKPETIMSLFQTSGNRCTYPKCKKKMIEDDGYLRGEICLIESNIKCESRYNPKINDEQRISFDNLLLFCHWHHFVVNNKKKHTIEKLKKIKYDSTELENNKDFQISDELIEKTIQHFKKYYSEFRIFKSDQKMKKGGIFKPLQSLLSFAGITICKKCGRRTKYKMMDDLDAGNVTLGYTLCHKCGNREFWITGGDAVGAGGG